MIKLPRSFYLRDPLTVARDLLGVHLVRKTGRNILTGRIVEVEAYLGSSDAASHAYRGRTLRNDAMFREGGHLYVYFTYGMHFCANIVTGPDGEAGAVLLRAVEPVDGVQAMIRNRTIGRPLKSRQSVLQHLTDGPAKLCQAFGITGKENGTDLLGEQIYCTEGEPAADEQVVATRRIGISANVSKKWRFVIRERDRSRL